METDTASPQAERQPAPSEFVWPRTDAGLNVVPVYELVGPRESGYGRSIAALAARYSCDVYLVDLSLSPGFVGSGWMSELGAIAAVSPRSFIYIDAHNCNPNTRLSQTFVRSVLQLARKCGT